MFIEYGIIAASFGVASYYGVYRKAKTAANEVLEKEESSIIINIVTFVTWVLLATVFMPLMLPIYFLDHESMIDSITTGLVEGMEE